MLGTLGVETGLWYASIALQVILLARFWRIGVVRAYLALVVSLAAELAESLVLIQIPMRSDAYTLTYVAWETLVMGSRVWVVSEIWRHVLSGYRGLSVLSRGLMFATVAVSLTLAVLLHARDLDFTHEISALIRVQMLWEGTVYAALLLFLVAQAVFVLWFPVPLKKNVLLYSFGYSFVFVGLVAGVHLRNVDARIWREMGSVARMLTYDVGLVVWIILFKRSWETETARLSVPRSADAQQGVLEQLDALNRVLQSGRKSF